MNNLLHLGTENGFQTLTQQGKTWQAGPSGLAGKPIIAVETNPQNPSEIFVAVPGYGLFKSSDAGSTWRQILSANAHSFLLDQTDPRQLWVGVEPAGLFHSLDGGATWADRTAALQSLPSAFDWTFPEPPYEPRLGVLAQMPAEASVILAGVQIGGLFRSADSGLTWQASDAGLYEDVQRLAVHPNAPQTWLAGTGDGVFASEDGGHTWQDLTADLLETYIAAVLVHPNGACFIAASGSPPGNWVENLTTTLYRTDGLSGAWAEVSLGEPQYITSLALAGDRLYLGTHSGLVYQSDDLGSTWEVIFQHSAGILSLHPA
jgi:photosystem II stability/assembly factor-like uncharacterized protein